MDLPSIVAAWLDAYNRGDVPALVACVTEDVVFENNSNTGPHTRTEGRADFAALAAQAARMFGQRRQTVRTAVVGADAVALDLDWTGIPAVDVGPFKAGRPAALRGASFLVLRDGLIARITDLS